MHLLTIRPPRNRGCSWTIRPRLQNGLQSDDLSSDPGLGDGNMTSRYAAAGRLAAACL